MLFFNLLVQILTAAAATIVAILDYVSHDKRTRRFRFFRRAVFVVLVAGAIGSVFSTWINDANRREERMLSNRQIAALTTNLATLRSEASEVAGSSRSSAANTSQQL